MCNKDNWYVCYQEMKREQDEANGQVEMDLDIVEDDDDESEDDHDDKNAVKNILESKEGISCFSFCKVWYLSNYFVGIYLCLVCFRWGHSRC